MDEQLYNHIPYSGFFPRCKFPKWWAFGFSTDLEIHDPRQMKNSHDEVFYYSILLLYVIAHVHEHLDSGKRQDAWLFV